MYGILTLPEDEVLICLFFRGTGSDSIDKVEAVDFQRRLNQLPPEGGLSFFRDQTTDYRFIADTVKRKPRLNRGFALISIKQLNELDIKVCGDLSINDQHVCIHCLSCDCQKVDCKPSPSLPCQLIAPENPLSDSDHLRKMLSEAMDVVIPATHARDDLLNIFSKDFPGTPSERNKEYARRWQVEMSRPAFTAEDIIR
jgi:hypothetical protein